MPRIPTVVPQPAVGWELDGRDASWVPRGVDEFLRLAYRLCVGRRVMEEGESIGEILRGGARGGRGEGGGQSRLKYHVY